jgi:hypothetical protein
MEASELRLRQRSRKERARFLEDATSSEAAAYLEKDREANDVQLDVLAAGIQRAVVENVSRFWQLRIRFRWQS